MNLFKKKTAQNIKYIAFSFDDGPNNDNTLKILKTLKKHNGKATFFLLGSRIENYSINANMYSKYNCEIGNHTWMHDDAKSNDANYILNSIIECQNTIEKVYKTKTKLMRPPGGNLNSDLFDNLKKYGLSIILWSIDAKDWNTKDINSIVMNVLKNAHDGDIVLMHDMKKETIEALKAILSELEKQGYAFVTISELFKLKGISLEPGKIYKSARQNL